MIRQGETCSINFASADASTAAPLILKDANAATRVLGSQERLIIDALTANVASAALNADVYAVADNTNTGDLIITSFAPGWFFFEWPSEGMSLPGATMPFVVAGHSGQVTITGVGRIVQDGSIQNQRPSWRDVLNGAGVPPGGGGVGNNGGIVPSQQPQTAQRAMAPDGLPDGSQNPVFVDPTPGSLLPPDNGGSI